MNLIQIQKIRTHTKIEKKNQNFTIKNYYPEQKKAKLTIPNNKGYIKNFKEIKQILTLR